LSLGHLLLTQDQMAARKQEEAVVEGLQCGTMMRMML
jgi:hypothetical protein